MCPAILLVLAGCGSPSPRKPAAVVKADPLHEFEQRAAQYHSVVSLPEFETTTNQLRQSLTHTIATGNAALDRIGQLALTKVTFKNTVRALDDVGFQLSLVANRFSLIEQRPRAPQTGPAVRRDSINPGAWQWIALPKYVSRTPRIR